MPTLQNPTRGKGMHGARLCGSEPSRRDGWGQNAGNGKGSRLGEGPEDGSLTPPVSTTEGGGGGGEH